MKPAPFTYHAPDTLAEALGLLAELGHEAKILAGGQSLIPLLNMRLAAPAHLVDINHLTELARTEVDAEGVRVGALVRHAELEHHAEAGQTLPLLRRALLQVAHPVIRNRGTTVGSIAHADPAAEMPAVLAVLDGEVELVSAGSSRTVSAADFFVGPLESCARAGELVRAVRFRRPRPASGLVGTAFVELARRHGDYALAGLAAVVTLDADQRVVGAHAAYLGVAGVPLRLDLTEALRPVAAGSATPEDFLAAGQLARVSVEPEADIHASVEYRRHLVAVLTTRALAAAARDAVPTPREAA